jgi:hypothetical protein
MGKLTDFMVSRVRAKLIKAFLSNPKEMYYVRQLTRMTNEEINAVRRELARLQACGMIKSEHRGNRLYYYAKPTYSYYPEMLAMVAKSSGLGRLLIKNKPKLGKIKFMMINGRFIRGLPHQADDVDLLVVGKVIMPQLSILVRTYEAKSKREVNYTVMTEEELAYRKARRDPFILSVLSSSRLMLAGDEQELVS